MAAQKSYTLDSFHKYFYDDSMCGNDVLLDRKLPPDNVKVRLLATAAYMVTLIICILIPAAVCGGVPVFWPSTTNLVPEDMSTCDKFHSYAMSPSCTHHFPFKHWTNSLDLLNPPSRSQLTQMIVPVNDVQRFQKSSQLSHFYYFLTINIPTFNIVPFSKYNVNKYSLNYGSESIIVGLMKCVTIFLYYFKQAVNVDFLNNKVLVYELQIPFAL